MARSTVGGVGRILEVKSRGVEMLPTASELAWMRGDLDLALATTKQVPTLSSFAARSLHVARNLDTLHA